MNASTLDCLVENYEVLVPSLDLPDPDDRHVLAAAIVGKVDVIVTQNLKDFPPAALNAFGISRQTPDTILRHLFDLHEGAVVAAAKEHRESLQNPTKTVAVYLDALDQAGLVEVAGVLRGFRELI